MLVMDDNNMNVINVQNCTLKVGKAKMIIFMLYIFYHNKIA